MPRRHRSTGSATRSDAASSGAADSEALERFGLGAELVPDDGQRYYADPFLFERGGVTYLFCEEFQYATSLGSISVAEMRADGTAGPFRSVLERPYHLSYPFVFEHDGHTWMVPEASAGGSVELYRCERFPDQWVLDRCLLDDVPGCDATIFEHEKRYWMILTATRWRGATSDKQRLYSAPSPLGPWAEFHQGLIRINAENTRPAGAILKLGNRLLRPAQNCSVRYGGSMALLEINTLSPTAFDEVQVATIETSPSKKPRGTHTYSRTSKFEAIDAWGQFSGETSVQLDFKLHRNRMRNTSDENTFIA